MNNDENDLLNPNDGQQQQNNESGNNNNEQDLNANNNDLLMDNDKANTQKINNNDEANKLNSKDSKKQNEQPIVDESEKKKKKEQVVIIAESNFNLLNYDDEKEKEVNNDNVIDQKLSSVSKSSGLNLKAYFEQLRLCWCLDEPFKTVEKIVDDMLNCSDFNKVKTFLFKIT